MSAIRKFQISIEDIVSVGATCRPENIKVSFEKPFCADIACEYDENTRTIDIEVGPECKDTCLYVVIECTEQCIDCYERIKVCACSGEADCDGCSDCIDGVCVSRCTHDEFCDGNECVECNSDIPCPDGKICENGKCVCPDGQFEDEAGRCVPCLPGECPPCHVCTPEGCKPIDCGDKVCDPTLNDCVDCVGSGDCGQNEKCVNNECVCKDGYVRNANGDCVKDRECNSDTDCPDCFECDEFGNCNPVICPAGEICIDGDCVVPCETGADCPPGFGCDGEKCVECNTLDCATTECADVLGCGCNKDNKCVDTTKCDGDCVSFADCGEGCTCYKGKCISCEDLPCDMCDVPGCACIGNKCTSVNVECTDDVTITEDTLSCDLIGKATIRNNCNCTPLTVTIEPTRATDTGEFDFRAILRKGSATSYTDATLKNSLDNVDAINIAENELPESGAISLEVELVIFRVDDNERRIANNITVSYFTSSFSFIGEAESIINNVKLERVGDIGKYHPKDNLDYKIYSQRIKIKHIADIEIPGSNCTYVENNDVIKNELIDAATYNELIASRNVNDPVFDVLKDYHNFTSDGVRNPFFTWYRIPATGTNFDLNDPNQAFRKMYISGSLGSYVDILKDKDDGLYNGYKYALHVDCPCDNNLDIQGQVKICNPNQFTGTFQNCGTEFTANTFSVCDINGFLGTNFQPSDAVVKYELLFDGSNPSSLPETKNVFKWNNTSLVNEDGDTMFQAISNGNDTIGSVTLRIFTDSTEICKYTIPGVEVDERVIDYELNCEGATPQVRVYKAGVSGGTISDLQVLDGSPNDQGSYWLLTKDGKAVNSFDVVATFANGCVKEETITVDICDCLEIGVSFNTDPIIVGQDADVQITVSGGYPGYNILILDPLNNNSVVAQRSTNDSLVNMTIPNISDQNYKIRVTTGTGCDKERVLSFSAINTDLQFEASTVCSGIESYFTVFNIPETMNDGNYILRYDLNGIPKSLNINSSGSITVFLGNLSIGEHTINNISIERSGSVLKTFNDTIIVEVIQEPVITEMSLVSQINGTPISSPVCVNTPVFVKIVGTPNTAVVLSNNLGQVVLDQNTGVGYIPLTTTAPDQFTIRVNELEFGNCQGSYSGSISLQINQPLSYNLIRSCENDQGGVIRYYDFVINGADPSTQGNITVINTDTGNSYTYDTDAVASNYNQDLIGTQYENWGIIRVEVDAQDFPGDHAFELEYNLNGCTYIQPFGGNVTEQCNEPDALLSVTRTDCCDSQDVEVQINDLQLQTTSGIEDIPSGQYNVVVLEDGSAVSSSVTEGSTATFTPGSTGNGNPIEYQINITSGTFAGLTLTQYDQYNVYNPVLDVTSSPVQSTFGETVTFVTAGDTFDSYQWTIDDGINPVVTATTTVNAYQWTAPNVNAATSVSVTGTGLKSNNQVVSSICTLTATTTHYTIFDCPTSISLDNTSDAVTITNETCVGSDGEIVIDEAELNSLGFTAPYDYTDGDLTGSTTSGLTSGTYTGNILDDSGCSISYNIIIEIIPEDLVPFNGSFEDCDYGTGGKIGAPTYVIETCGAVSDSSGTVDVWTTPVDINRNFGPAGLQSSPDGGQCVGAHSAGSGEEFTFQINVEDGKTYTLNYHQSFGGNNDAGTIIDSTARWTITLDGNVTSSPIVEYSPIMNFNGFGNQTWSQGSIVFTANGTGVVDVSFKSDDSAPGVTSSATRHYIVVDGITITENCL